MQISEATKVYWKDEDYEELSTASSVSALYKIALRILSRMPKEHIVQVCGPIATGGLGSVEKNLIVFNDYIQYLQSKNLIVFDQMPFEIPIQELKKKREEGVYMEDVLLDFYLPIFESGNISKLYFIKNWESSRGALWEHEQAKRLGIEIEYFK